MRESCAIIGCSPMCFPWGFDEEAEGCAALKLILMNRITKLRNEGCARFTISMDCGVGLYAAEILAGLRETDGEIEFICYIPYEEQATKWTPELRDSYFNALAACADVVYAGHEKAVGCEFRAHLQAIAEADAVIAVYDSDDPLSEREIASVAVAELLEKQIIFIDPRGIHF